MDLIYGKFKSDGTVEDVNVLLDYSFDEVYGIGESGINDFELKVQKYNNRCTVNDAVYIEYTEYGGIIDRIEHDSKKGVVTYKGRSWHGILNSYVIQPPQGFYCRTYGGEINAIIRQMLIDCDVDGLFNVDAVPESERNIRVECFTVRYEKLYDAIIRLLNRKEVGEGKMLCYFHDGQVHIGGVRACDYSISDEFDTSQMPYKAGVTFNNVNHLICIGGGDEYDNKPVIHLFANESGTIQPYKLVDNPLEDNEYILDERNKAMLGLKEITEIFDCPSASVITNYKHHSKEPEDWERHYFERYYEDGERDENGNVKKQLVKQIFRDEYHLVKSEPSNWRTNFTDYYKRQNLEITDANKYYRIKDMETIVEGQNTDTGVTPCRFRMVNVKELTQDEATTVVTYSQISEEPEDWKINFNSYYMYSSTDPSGRVSVSARTYDTYGNNDLYDGVNILEHTGEPSYIQAPQDWATNYMNLTTRTKNALDKWVYGVSIQGVPQSHMERRDSDTAPENWTSDVWRQFYVKVTKKSKLYKNKNIPKLVKNEGYFVKTTDAVAQGELTFVSNKKQYPKYRPKKYWYEVQDAATPPSFEDYSNGTKGYGVFIRYSHSVAPIFDTTQHQYYRKDVSVDTVPPFEQGRYYTITKGVEQIPDYKQKMYYYAVQDRIKNLLERGLEKFEQIKDTTTFDVDLELNSNYDVGDVMGLEDEITKETIRKPIMRKIIKIKKDILSVDYEVM